MTGEKRKLARLQRLERVRAIAKQTAANEAARAESTLVQLEALAARSQQLATEYRERHDALDGSELRRLGVFATALQGVSRNTGADAARARATADRRQQELAAAERGRAAVQDRADATERAIQTGSQAPILSGRRQLGANERRNPASSDFGTILDW